MCVEAEALYGGCLSDWGVGWSAAGYRDAADFRDACETWGWEMAVLEQDAVARGEADKGTLEATCAERAEAFAAEDATCKTYTGIDWSTPPWSP